jgi:hypothetical protein
MKTWVKFALIGGVLWTLLAIILTPYTLMGLGECRNRGFMGIVQSTIINDFSHSILWAFGVFCPLSI